jgi:hypothetical protein
MRRTLLAVALGTLLFAGLVVPAQGASGYALAAVRNTTGVTISYYYWWGHQGWYDGGSDAAALVTLLPGASHYYAWPYREGEEGSAPPLNVAFSSYTPGRRDAYLKVYSLATAEAPAQEERYYTHYHFGWGVGGRLDLFESR